MTKPWPSVASVVGAGNDLAAGAQLLLQDDPLARPAADHARDLNATAVQLAGDGEHDGGVHTPADADRVPRLQQLGGPAEGACDVLDRIADLEIDQVVRALADRLDHQRDGPTSESALAIVRGMRSASGPSRTMTN